MKGIVDDELRALVDVSISATAEGEMETIRILVDTAFNGDVVMPRIEIERLGLREATSTRAILADGNEVDLPTYTCYLEWFGSVYRTQVVANDGEHPLLGLNQAYAGLRFVDSGRAWATAVELGGGDQGWHLCNFFLGFGVAADRNFRIPASEDFVSI